MRTPLNTYDELAITKVLDPVTTTVFTEATDIRAEARLQQILATDRTAPTSATARVPKPSRTPAWRWAAIPVAAAAAIGLGIVLPGGIGAPPARANLLNWESYTTPLTDEELAAADAVCRREINDFTVDGNRAAAENPTFFSNRRAIALVEQPAVAERRGEWGVIGYPQDGVLTVCQVWLSPDGPQIAMFQGISGATAYSSIISPGAEGISQRGGAWDLSDAELMASPAPDRVDVRNKVETSVPAGVSPVVPDGVFFTVVGGRVGEDVTGLTLHTLTGGDVEAMVQNGWWIAWWPGAMGGPDTYLVYVAPEIAGWDEFGNPVYDDGEPVRMWTRPGTDIISGYTTTLADGSGVPVEENWAEECSPDDTPACFYDQSAAEAKLAELQAEYNGAQLTE